VWLDRGHRYARCLPAAKAFPASRARLFKRRLSSVGSDAERSSWLGRKGHGGGVRINAALPLLSLLPPHPQIVTFSNPVWSQIPLLGIHFNRSSGHLGYFSPGSTPIQNTAKGTSAKRQVLFWRLFATFFNFRLFCRLFAGFRIAFPRLLAFGRFSSLSYPLFFVQSVRSSINGLDACSL
jgi:hypothetical protein